MTDELLTRQYTDQLPPAADQPTLRFQSQCTCGGGAEELREKEIRAGARA